MQKNNRLLLFLALVKLIIPFILQDSFYQPHRDEFLYLAEGNHPAWGFMEVPPLLSVFAWLTNLCGGSMFWIKIWPALFGAFTFFLVGKIILSLGGKKFALLLGWLPFIFGSYMRLFFLFQPNFLEVFFWTAIAFTVISYIQTGKNKWLYLLGISIGLGMMSKYSVAFFTVSILVGLLITRQRRIFLNKHFYYSLLLALIIFLPNLFWQYNHRFPVIAHMKELQEEQLQYIDGLDFIISQFLMNIACVFIWIAGLLFTIFSSKGKVYRFIGWAYLAVILLLFLLHGKNYYSLGAYPVLFAFGAYFLERITQSGFVWIRYVMVAFIFLFGIFLMPLSMPLAKPDALVKYYSKKKLNKTGGFKWEDQEYHPLPQDFADMIGWKELSRKTAAVYNNLSKEERDSTLIYCYGYYTAGALNYYGVKMGLPEVYSDDASFLFWLPEKFNVKNLLVIGRKMPDVNKGVFSHFRNGMIKDSMNMPLFRENGMKIMLFENADDSLNTMLEKIMRESKEKFMR